MRQLYNVILNLLLPFALLRLAVRALRNPKYRERWSERLAYRLPSPPDPAPIWIHAVSVGEVVAAVPLVEGLQSRFPNVPLLVTSTTPTGAEMVARLFGASVLHTYFPFDLSWIVRRYIRHFLPRMLVLMETELWPNLLYCCAESQIPVVVANARLSEKSLVGYNRFPTTTRHMLAGISALAVQSESDGRRFCRLGADQNFVVNTGSLKFDLELGPSVSERGQSLRRYFGPSRNVIMAGSTRPGEEQLLLDSFAALLERFPGALLLLAPRHPERFDEVAALIKATGLNVVRHSDEAGDVATKDVYLIDVMGELPSFYAAADVAFVGGSLVPLGGHNVLEPAALGIPVVVGPHTYNFAEINELLKSAGALKTVDDAASLTQAVDLWLRDSETRDCAGRAGQQLVARHRGATQRVVDLIADVAKF